LHRDYNKSKDHEWLRNVKSKEKFQLKYDSRIIKDSADRIFIIIPEPLKVKVNVNVVETQDNKIRMAAIDPGVRTFSTLYDNNGNVFEYGAKDIKKIFHMCLCADNLQSRIYKKKTDGSFQIKHRNRYKMRKAFRKIQMKIKDRVRDFHHKVAKHICMDYDFVLLPKFDTQNMMKKKGRKLRKKTVRQMATWSHFLFRKILLHKAQKYGCFVKLCTEEYTSKCCSHCGNIKYNLGSQKNYYCRECKKQFDRDINASKNIMMKYLIETQIKESLDSFELGNVGVPSPDLE